MQKAFLCLLSLLTVTLSFLGSPLATRAAHGAQAVGKPAEVVVQQAGDGKDIPLTVAEKSNYKATSRFQETGEKRNQRDF